MINLKFINQFHNAKFEKFKVVMITLCIVVSLGLMYMNKFSFGIGSAEYNRFSLKGENAQSVYNDLNSKYDFDSQDRVRDDAGNTTYRLYLLQGNSNFETIKNELSTIQGTAVSQDYVINSKGISYVEVVIFFASISILFTVVTLVIFAKNLKKEDRFVFVLANIDVYYVTILVVLGLISALSLLGWQQVEFTKASIIGISIFVLVYQLINNFVFADYLLDKKNINLVESYKLFVTDHLTSILLRALVVIIIILPLLVLFDLTVEIGLLLFAFILIVKMSIMVLPSDIKLIKQIFVKVNKQEAKKKK